MLDIFSQLKKSVLEPKVYTVLVSSTHGVVLYMGIHFTLDEAYTAARIQIESLAKHESGESVDIDMWNSVSVRDIVSKIVDPSKVTLGIAKPMINKKRTVIAPELPFDLNKLIAPKNELGVSKKPTIAELMNDVKKAKNGLLKKLIDDGSVEDVQKLHSSIITPYEKRYVIQRITGKKVVKESKTS